jgi:phage-related protein
MQAICIHQGKIRKVSALAVKDSVPIYKEELSMLDQTEKSRIAIYIEKISDSRFPVYNKTISKKLTGSKHIYELRPLPVRLFFFMVHNDIVITHGFVKKKNKTDKTEIERAEQLRKTFLRGE